MQQRRLSRIIQTKEQEFSMLVQQTKRRKRIPDYTSKEAKKVSFHHSQQLYIIPFLFFSSFVSVCLSVLFPADLRGAATYTS